MPIAYITPRALLTDTAAAEAIAAQWAWPLLGGRFAFAAMDVSTRVDGARQTLGTIVRTAYDKDAGAIPRELRKAIEDQLGALASAPKPFAGFTDGPALMGVLNVTPDSFSDGGQHGTTDAAVAHGITLAEAGAAIIDVGGESTRPGAAPVDQAEEIRRTIPVIEALASRGITVSIDTRHAAVMREGINAGARIVNDITALTGNPQSLAIVADAGVPVILMHMQGEPQTMQRDPTYVWAPGDIYDYLKDRIAACVAGGIAKDRIAVDPGIGFGKTDVHNAALFNHLAMFHGLGCAVVLGASRKGFISRMSQGEGADHRLAGSLAAALHGAAQGVQILRVHDVAETRQALAIFAHLS
jgi:dihydropteroate synthase